MLVLIVNAPGVEVTPAGTALRLLERTTDAGSVPDAVLVNVAV
jgi:hypothetical protein